MIRSLRWKLAVITMILLSLVLLLTMGMFFSSTYQEMEKDSLKALHQSGMRYGLHEEHREEKPPKREKVDRKPKGDEKEEPSPIPCFVVGYDHGGQFYAEGPGYYDLSDLEDMETLLKQALETGEEYGILWAQRMRFLRLDDICGNAYAMTNISSEMQYLQRLLLQYFFIGFLAILAFLTISLLTSWWATRPVDRVMKQQRQFVADASHELKTPLTVILTNAELLASEEYSLEERKQFTGSVLTMALQMRGLVEELLDLARAENGSGNQHMELLNLSRLVSDGVLPFEPVYFEADRLLDSRVTPELHIQGNPHELQRVLDILLDNGCKYSLPGSTVRLRLTRQGLKQCTLTVESPGDTMTAQECRDIFKRFYRRDQSRSMNHSYGLGLAIAKTVVRRHKGKIWARSKNGVNTFCVRLPLKLAQRHKEH